MRDTSNSDLISLWVDAYLHEMNPKYPLRSRAQIHNKNNDIKKTTVVFGRTSHRINLAQKEIFGESKNDSGKTGDKKENINKNGAGMNNKYDQSSIDGTTSIDTRNIHETTKNDNGSLHYRQERKSGETLCNKNNNNNKVDSKVSGRQIMVSKHDYQMAKEKRKRQMNYALSVADSRKCSVSLHINSLTRVVVQSFRKLIDCERCALFLMDHSTNELYFKPIACDNDGIENVKEIRFSASTGVAGWVASRKQTLNIKNAYQDSRFNSDIDKQTKFRTRSILCMPVLSSKEGHLFGVIQMVNKKKGDTKVLQSLAKKKKTDMKNHGYEVCFEPFSEEDEQILERCCLQVSRALEPVMLPNKKQKDGNNTTATTSHNDNDVGDSRNQNNSKVSSNEKNHNPLKHDSDQSNKNHTAATNTSHGIKVTPRRNSLTTVPKNRRRSSIGNLLQFVNEFGRPLKNASNTDLFDNGSSVSEAMSNFKFRSSKSGPQISAKHGQLMNDPDRIIAASKRKRMTEYNTKRRESLLLSNINKSQN